MIKIAVTTLKTTCEKATLLPFSFEVSEAKTAVKIVPIFAPIANDKAFI